MEGIKYEGIDIKIEDINYENLIKYKYQFFSKNQIFGTCWANAYAASIFLTNKRILGKQTETFETYRENLIKLTSIQNHDTHYAASHAGENTDKTIRRIDGRQKSMENIN